MKNKADTASVKSDAQAAGYLSLIEEERQAFIKKDFGRLQAVIGLDYWDKNTGETHFFHQYFEDGKETDTVIDPYELDVSELAMLPDLTKRVERIGTYSYLAFYQMFPEDKKRMKLLADVWSSLKDGCICTDDEVKELVDGHAAYLDWKTEDSFEVIMPDDNR